MHFRDVSTYLEECSAPTSGSMAVDCPTYNCRLLQDLPIVDSFLLCRVDIQDCLMLSYDPVSIRFGDRTDVSHVPLKVLPRQ